MACKLCEPAPHEECETYTKIWVEHPIEPDTETKIEVCLQHYETVKSAFTD